MARPLRRLLLSRLLFNLAAGLGAAQLALAYWAWVVVAQRPGPPAAAWLGAGAGLVAANAALVPAILRARRRGGLVGAAARAYLEAGVATLLLAAGIAASGGLALLASGLLGALGAPGSAGAALRAASLAGAGAVALMAAWGFTGGQARVARSQRSIAIPGLDASLVGLRLVQISDLHIGNALEGERLSRLVERVNVVRADLLVVTGDLFDRDPRQLEDGARRLSALRARLGVYAILGNHDHRVGSDRVAAALARWAPGIRLLRDAIARVPASAPLYLAGLEDPGRGWSERRLRYPSLDALAAARPDDGPVLLLAHQPEVVGQAAELGFPLVLAGHTHGGQIALPTPGGRYNLSRLLTRYTRGLYRVGDTALYVNRGLGVGGPALRIHCPREIAVLELAARPARAGGGAGGARAPVRTGPRPAPEPQIAFSSTSTRRKRRNPTFS
jgi:uncharacterized protein